MRSFDLPAFASHLNRLAAGVAAEEQVLLDCAAQAIKAEAKRAIAQHQNAIGPSAPRESNLHGSIEHTVAAPAAYVGSNLPEAEARELGSPITPPESFLSGSAFRKAAEVRDLISDRFSNYLADGTQ